MEENEGKGRKYYFITSALILVLMSVSSRKKNKKQTENPPPLCNHRGITETSTLKFTFFVWLHIRVYLDPIIFTTLSWKVWDSQPMQLNAKSM